MPYTFYSVACARTISLVTVFLAASSFSSPSYADDSVSSTMSPIIVSATRIPTSINEVASSVTVITSGDIEAKQERTLPDVLRDVIGLNLVQNGGEGAVAAVFIRGTNSNHTKVLVDGIDISDPSAPTGAFDFASILASDIERVEVLRGAQSGLYGSDAIGGVINIITKQGSGKPQLIASAEAGSFATFNQNVGASGSQGRFNYTFNADHFHAGDTPVTPAHLLPAGVPNHGDSHDNLTFSSKLGAELTDNFDIGLVTRYTQSDAFYTGDDNFAPYNSPDSVQSESRDKEVFTRATAHQKLFDGVFDQTFGLGYTYYHRDDFYPNNAPMYNEGERVKADWQGNIKLAQGEVVTLGAEHQHDAITDSPISAHVDNNAGFVQLQSTIDKHIFNTVSLRYDDNERFGGKTTYRLAPSYLFTDTDTRIKGSLGTGFKAPTINQLFVDYPAWGFYANPNLKPETSVSYDIGFEQNLLNKKVQFGSTYFHNDIKNLIAANSDFSTDINLARATTYGFENFIAYKPLNILSLRADYTFTIAKDETHHQELIRRPKNKASLNATWQATAKTSLAATLLYTGSWIDGNRDFSIPRLKANGYTTADLAASYDLNDKVALFGRISNLFNRHYENPVGFEQQGIGVFAGIRGKF